MVFKKGYFCRRIHTVRSMKKVKEVHETKEYSPYFGNGKLRIIKLKVFCFIECCLKKFPNSGFSVQQFDLNAY